MRTIKKIFNTTVSVKEGASRSILRGIVQHDTLNEVNIRLSDGSKAFDYYGYTSIIFKVLKADGTSYIDSEGENVIATSPEDGIVTVILKGQATAAAGLCQSVIEIYADGEKMTTARLNYEVFEALNTAEETESESQYPVFQNLMDDLSALEASIEAAEEKRVAAETARVALETGYVARAEKAAKDAEMWVRASQDIDEGDYATRAELEAVRDGAAPAGFGLGSYSRVIEDCNDALENGWYCTYANAANRPYGMNGAFINVLRTADEVAQIYFSYGYSVRCVRTKVGGVWGEWEWVNPLMQAGVEYRTTERYNAYPVYKKLVSFGALPNATSKTVDVGFGSGYIIGIESVFSPNQGYCLDKHPNISGVVGSGANIIITTTADMSANNVMVLVKYYKTTG